MGKCGWMRGNPNPFNRFPYKAVRLSFKREAVRLFFAAIDKFLGKYYFFIETRAPSLYDIDTFCPESF
jgi:hypothetical protein